MSEQASTSVISVVGALAYDDIARVNEAIGSAITGNYKVSQLHRAFGGCGGNIAYNLVQLGQPANCVRLVSELGTQDAQPYLEHLRNLKLDTQHILMVPDAMSHRAIILTDTCGDQLTAFYAGSEPREQEWSQVLSDGLAGSHCIVQAPLPPDVTEAAITVASGLRPRPLIVWTPGQYVETFKPNQLNHLLAQADWVVGNTTELTYLRNQGLTALDANLVIETQGPQPVQVHVPGQSPMQFAVPAADDVVDPTGCGDSFIAGCVYAHVVKRMTLPESVELGIRQATQCLGQRGSQKH